MNIEITLSVKADNEIFHAETVQREINPTKWNAKSIAIFINKFFQPIDEEKEAQRKFERLEELQEFILDNIDDVTKSNPQA